MKIPEQVLRQAMDAVGHRKTTAQIRAFGDSGIEASPSFTPVKARAVEFQPSQPGPLTDAIRRKAMDAVLQCKTMSKVRLVADNAHIVPDHTPSLKRQLIAGRIVEMYKTGQNVAVIQAAITKDNFGKQRER